MDLNEIKVTFFEECADQMSELESGLFSISANEPDIETVNSVFRAVHSIKGGAGSFGLDDLVQFAHAFESALDIIRTDITQATEKRLDLLLRATDMLADIIEVSRDGGEAVDSSAIIEELGLEFNLDEMDHSTCDDATDETEYTAVPISIMDMELEEPTSTYQYSISFAPKPELYLCGHDPRQIFRELSQLGDYSVVCDTDRIPSLDEFDLGESYLAWTIEFKTEKTEEEVRSLFEWVDSCCELTIADTAGEDMTIDGGLDDILANLELEEETIPTSDPEDEQISDDDASADFDLECEETKALSEDDESDNQDESEPKVAPAAAQENGETSKSTKTIRVESLKVDNMINLMGELVISQAMLTEEINVSSIGLSSPLGLALTQLQNLTREIQGSVMAIRAQPVKPVFMRMSRVIREICSATGKKANLIFEGEHTEVDSTVIEGLVGPLTHMIRNAIDHGIEQPEVRRELGKPESGTIHLSASHNSGRILLEVKDDGAGINREKVLEKAVRSGIVTSEAKLSDSEVDDLIFSAGFSTADVVTDVSGRGVGMDVVRQSVQSMGGRVSISSQPNEGSQFTLSLPLTLAILDGMVINDADQVFVVPISSVLETLSVRGSNVFQIGNGSQVIKLRDNLVPIVDVAYELGFAEQRSSYAEGTILIVECGVNAIGAFIVDSIVGQQQVVIKSLERNYQRVPSIAAATILGNGNIALVLDVDDIVRSKVKDASQHNELKLIA